MQEGQQTGELKRIGVLSEDGARAVCIFGDEERHWDAWLAAVPTAADHLILPPKPKRVANIHGPRRLLAWRYLASFNKAERQGSATVTMTMLLV
jgi:hypothetical protein